MKVHCIIPAYNEAKTIREVILKVKPLVDKVVIVDDCSNDGTHAITSKLGVTTLRHLVNRGQGASLQTGTDFALKDGAEIIVHFDADGQFQADEIKDVVGPISSGQADVVLGSRFLGKKSDMPMLKENFIMPIARLVNRIFLGINLTDPQSGFRAFSRAVGIGIRIDQDRMAHCSEFLSKVFAARYRVREVPIKVIYHDFGQRIGGGVKILKELFMGSLIK